MISSGCVLHAAASVLLLFTVQCKVGHGRRQLRQQLRQQLALFFFIGNIERKKGLKEQLYTCMLAATTHRYREHRPIYPGGANGS